MFCPCLADESDRQVAAAWTYSAPAISAGKPVMLCSCNCSSPYAMGAALAGLGIAAGWGLHLEPGVNAADLLPDGQHTSAACSG